MDIVVAEKAVVAESADGVRTAVQIRIGRPYRVAEKTWSCPLKVEGLGRISDGLGTDSWHALTVAIGVLRQHLNNSLRSGNRFLSEDDDSELELEDLFPQF